VFTPITVSPVRVGLRGRDFDLRNDEVLGAARWTATVFSATPRRHDVPELVYRAGRGDLRAAGDRVARQLIDDTQIMASPPKAADVVGVDRDLRRKRVTRRAL